MGQVVGTASATTEGNNDGTNNENLTQSVESLGSALHLPEYPESTRNRRQAVAYIHHCTGVYFV